LAVNSRVSPQEASLRGDATQEFAAMRCKSGANFGAWQQRSRDRAGCCRMEQLVAGTHKWTIAMSVVRKMGGRQWWVWPAATAPPPSWPSWAPAIA
jgi:hypothetical protein